MTVEELEAKVASAKEKVEKCKVTIQRHEQQFGKKLQALAKWGINADNMEEKKWKGGVVGTGGSANYYEICDVEGKQRDIKGAIDKLKDAEGILANWQAKLDITVEKDRFLNDNAPEVIKQFLEQWKTKVFEWNVKRYEKFQVLKKELADEAYEARVHCVKTMLEYSQCLDENGEIKEYYRNNLLNIHPSKPIDKYLKEKELDYRSIKIRETNFAGHMVLRMCDYRDEAERLAYLNKELEAEKRYKMLDLINRVNKVVGSITDATKLKIDGKGNLNGIILGEKASAKVETIGAGGWNIQCWHYRTLVHKL